VQFVVDRAKSLVLIQFQLRTATVPVRDAA